MYIRRHWLAILLFSLILTSLTVPWRVKDKPSNVAIPPSPVIVEQAVVIDQGVSVTWLEAQPGTYPVGSYVIERGRGSSGFKRIARVDDSFLKYLDAEGRTGDAYRIIAEDTRHPAERSDVSEAVVASPALPGNVAVTTAPVHHTLGISTAGTPDTGADELQKLMARAFVEFDAALARNNVAAARNHLNELQNYQRHILFLVKQLSPAWKVSLANVCAEQADMFRTNLYLLPESDQLDGMIVTAGCDAIREAA